MKLLVIITFLISIQPVNAIDIDLCLYDGSPVLSPDGQRIAFVSGRSGDIDIWTMNVDGSGLMQLTQGLGRNTNPVWSPDGTLIAFLSQIDMSKDLWVMNTDGTNKVQLTPYSPGEDGRPSWSNDSQYIAIPATDGNNSHIWIISPDGSIKLNVTEGKGAVQFKWPDWSYDNQWIVFTTLLNSGVWKVRSDGSELQEISDVHRYVWAVWSPVDDNILTTVVSQDTWNSTELWLMETNGENLNNLTTHHPSIGFYAIWKPDGQQIIFTSDHAGESDIWIMNSDGTNALNLTSDLEGDVWYPATSADGKLIVFELFEDLNSDVWIMNIDGTNTVNLTQDNQGCS